MASTLWFLLLVSASSVLGRIVIDDLEVERSWLQFKQEHTKRYSSQDEEAYRKQVFEKSLQDVFEHQLAYERGEYTYTTGINQFSDMPFEEWLEHRKITCSLTSRADNSANATRDIINMLEELGNPPPTQDWEKKGFVSMDVRNQNIGACGGCYAFAAVSAIESAHAIKHGLAGKVPNLSEQQIIDCGGPYGCNGCKGGHPCSAYDTVIHLGGLDYEASYPWRKDQKPQKCQFKKSKKVVTISAYNEHSTPTDRDFNLQVLVGLKGPATVSVCANKKFKEYKGGLFSDSTCLSSCKKTNPDEMNHSIVAIAYTKDYFIVRNSWGAKWGMKGNMMISRGKGSKDDVNCGLGIDQSVPII